MVKRKYCQERTVKPKYIFILFQVSTFSGIYVKLFYGDL